MVTAQLLRFYCTVSLQAVAFGMGGGLLQRLNRDTMSFATKLSHIAYADGTQADIMKLPKSDPLKFSLPGVMAVKMVGGVPTAFPAEGGHVKPEENMLHVVWDHGPVQVCDAHCNKQWYSQCHRKSDNSVYGCANDRALSS